MLVIKIFTYGPYNSIAKKSKIHDYLYPVHKEDIGENIILKW